MGLKNFVIKLILKRKVKAMLDKLTSKLSGYRTYITATVGILIALVGVVFGPIDLAGVSIPKITFNDFFKVVWEAALVVFLRKGIK